MDFCVLMAAAAQAKNPPPPRPDRRSVGSSKDQIHNFEFGRINYTDRLIYSTRIVRPSKVLKVIFFEETIQTKGCITFIQVLDQKRDGNGGFVFLTDGGVGQSHVKLHFRSTRGQGVNFLVNIYGRLTHSLS